MSVLSAGSGSAKGRLAVVAVATLAVNLLIFSLAELLTMDRRLDQDLTDPVPVTLVTLPTPEDAPPPERTKPPEPKPKPKLDFRPSLAPPTPGVVAPDAVAVTVDADFSGGGFDATGLVFESGDLDTPPRALPRAAPPFPYRARQRNVSGAVTVKLRVEKDGSVGSVEILEAEPKGYFEDSVLRTVPTWRFQPGIIAGQPVASWVVTTIQFDIPD